MSCEHCIDPDGEPCMPSYGVAPHTCFYRIPGAIIGQSEVLPRDQWPDNFIEDEGNPGHGIYWCPHCNEGKPMSNEESTRATTAPEEQPRKTVHCRECNLARAFPCGSQRCGVRAAFAEAVPVPDNTGREPTAYLVREQKLLGEWCGWETTTEEVFRFRSANPRTGIQVIEVFAREPAPVARELRRCSKFGHRCNCLVDCDPSEPHPSVAAGGAGVARNLDVEAERREFETHVLHVFRVRKSDGSYESHDVEMQWSGWRAARGSEDKANSAPPAPGCKFCLGIGPCTMCLFDGAPSAGSAGTQEPT